MVTDTKNMYTIIYPEETNVNQYQNAENVLFSYQ